MHININTLEKSRTAGSDKNTNSCPKTCNKTVTGYIIYHTSKILQTRKLEKSIFSVLSHYFKDAKFTVDGSCVVTVLCAAEQVASSSLSGGSCWQCFRSRHGAHARGVGRFHAQAAVLRVCASSWSTPLIPMVS